MNDSILFWNQVALDTMKEDFSSSAPEVEPSPQQGGPTFGSRALAIVHLAMYDAFVAGNPGGTYLSYAAPPAPALPLGAQRAAVATAATETLIALYSRQAERLRRLHQDFVAELAAPAAAVNQGMAWGRRVALAILADRANDGSQVDDSAYTPSPEVGRHRKDPLNPGQPFLGVRWGEVKPFVINNISTVIPGIAPPAPNTAAYASAYNEVKAKGAEKNHTRTPDETTVGLFWAYDGPRNIGVPMRLYNQVVRAISEKVGATEAQNARLFAMVNAAMGDAGIQAWAEKYRFDFWRPVVGVREADQGWGPTGDGDGNAATAGDPSWLPLGAPRSNQPQRVAFTPPFPAYPSGHATFGAAALVVARDFLALAPGFTFEFVSDELNGSTLDRDGSQRARHKRSLTVAKAIQENLESRVWLGVHWRFDGDEGAKNGAQIASLVVTNFPARV